MALVYCRLKILSCHLLFSIFWVFYLLHRQYIFHRQSADDVWELPEDDIPGLTYHLKAVS